MNTIAFTISCILAVFIDYVSSVQHLPSENLTTVNGPYNFYFSSYNQFLSSEITLKNIPSSVTTISLIYSGRFVLSVRGETPEILRVDKEIKNGQVTIPFLKSLKYQRIWIDVELKTAEGLCTKSKVAEGRYTYSPNYWDHTIRKMVYWNTNWTYDSTSSCVSPQKCEIVIDFHNQCEEKISCDYNATKYICTLRNENLKNSQTYELCQTFNYEPFIEVYCTFATNTKLIMELESFDNNTSVFVTKPKENNDILVVWSNKIILTAKDVVKDKTVRTLNYSESTNIQFGCEEYIFPPKVTGVFTVLINTKENKIQALDEAKNIDKYRINMEVNGFILCCMYYSFELTADGEDLQITRIVANKTLLMYQPEEPVSHKVENPAKKFSCDYNATKCTCTLHHELKDSQTYQLVHVYDNEPFIDFYINIFTTNTKLIMELESFDNNTSVNVVKSKNKSELVWSKEIILTAKDVVEDKIVGTLNYSESTDIQFDCDEYLSQPKILSVFTVLINTKENKIQALDEARNIDKYRINLEVNGFILCCMYYSFELTADGEDLQITRIVVNKTLLMYQPEEPVSHKVENPAKKFSCDYNATKYTCTLHHELKDSQTYQLVHVYDNEPFIDFYINIFTTNTKLIMELESFDNNTSVNVVKSKNKSELVWSKEIILTAKDVVGDKIVGTLNYSESTDIQFDCDEYLSQPKILRAYTVLINKKENKIKRLDEATKKIDINTIKMEDNGSILCCMYYSFEWTTDFQSAFQITRVVVNKTTLIYQPKESLSPKAENTADTKDLAMSSTQSNNNYIWMVYVLAAIIGVSVLIFSLYFISKQGWLTKSRPVEETVELDNITHQNQVLYADLDFVKNANQPSRDQNEESHYATIIGELHPH